MIKSMFGLDELLSGFFSHEMIPKDIIRGTSITLNENIKKYFIMINIIL
tara:strand:- start:3513 stop:3659 length:147 start_codon:yes stop_codon:yes gene_type:complete